MASYRVLGEHSEQNHKQQLDGDDNVRVQHAQPHGSGGGGPVFVAAAGARMMLEGRGVFTGDRPARFDVRLEAVL